MPALRPFLVGIISAEWNQVKASPSAKALEVANKITEASMLIWL